MRRRINGEVKHYINITIPSISVFNALSSVIYGRIRLVIYSVTYGSA